jgi:putative transposase
VVLTLTAEGRDKYQNGILMTNIRRYYALGHTYFVTIVTYKRQPFLIKYYEMLWDSVKIVKELIKFDIIAWVVMPEHFHMLIYPEEKYPSEIIKRIKQSIAMKCLNARNKASGRIWQNRFWDHIIRNEKDMERHFHYIHYNPAKHGLVRRPYDYKFSSMRDFMDIYDPDWGVNEKVDTDGKYGE